MKENIVYTGGTFDLPHAGHVNFLRQCRDIAGRKGLVVVSLNRDEFIERYKGKRPILSFAERSAIVGEFKTVDLVIENIGDEDSKVAIELVHPTHIVIGDDWKKKDYHKQMGFTPEWLCSRKIELVYVPYTEGISTTEIKRRLQ